MPRFFVNVMKFTGFFVAEGVGGLAVAVGLLMLLWHITGGAAIAAVVATFLVLLTPALLTVAIILWLVVLYKRAKARGEAVDEDGQMEALMRKSRFISMFLESKDETSKSAGAEPQSTEP